jgi:hypothetical protein
VSATGEVPELPRRDRRLRIGPNRESVSTRYGNQAATLLAAPVGGWAANRQTQPLIPVDLKKHGAAVLEADVELRLPKDRQPVPIPKLFLAR